MSENTDDKQDHQQDHKQDDSGVGISDDQLPEDLVPSEDNPLAEGLPDGETADDDLLAGGEGADDADDQQSEDDPSDNG